MPYHRAGVNLFGTAAGYPAPFGMRQCHKLGDALLFTDAFLVATARYHLSNLPGAEARRQDESELLGSVSLFGLEGAERLFSGGHSFVVRCLHRNRFP